MYSIIQRDCIWQQALGSVLTEEDGRLFDFCYQNL
jgi:hypothetical protein